MRGFPFFDLEKSLFRPYLLSKLSEEVEICCVYLVGAVNVIFGGFVFSGPMLPLAAQKYGDLVAFLLCFDFILRIETSSKLNYEVEIWYVHLVMEESGVGGGSCIQKFF